MKKEKITLVLVASCLMLTACGHSKKYDLVAPTEEMKALLSSDYTPSLEIEKEEFSVQAIADSSLDPGVVVEVQKGQPGMKKSIYRTYQEGEGADKKENKTLFSQILLKESKAEIVHYGPKKDDQVEDGKTVEVGKVSEEITDNKDILDLLKEKNLVDDKAEMMSREEAEKLSKEKKEKEEAEKKAKEDQAQAQKNQSTQQSRPQYKKKPASNSQTQPKYPQKKKTPLTPQAPPPNQGTQKKPDKTVSPLPGKNPNGTGSQNGTGNSNHTESSDTTGNQTRPGNKGLTDKDLNELLNTKPGKNNGDGNSVPEPVGNN